jgi:ankyrin repeat protein
MDAFHTACSNGDIKTVTRELTNGIKVNSIAKDGNGLTALLIAYKHSQIDVANYLLTHGINYFLTCHSIE